MSLKTSLLAAFFYVCDLVDENKCFLRIGTASIPSKGPSKSRGEHIHVPGIGEEHHIIDTVIRILVVAEPAPAPSTMRPSRTVDIKVAVIDGVVIDFLVDRNIQPG